MLVCGLEELLDVRQILYRNLFRHGVELGTENLDLLMFNQDQRSGGERNRQPVQL